MTLTLFFNSQKTNGIFNIYFYYLFIYIFMISYFSISL